MTRRFKPEMIQMEINTECNLTCPSCPLSGVYRGREPAHVSFDQFAEVFGREFTDPHLTIFSGFSETLLNQDLWPMIAFEKERGNMVFLGTNGTLLDEENIERVIHAGVDRMVISLEAPDPGVYRGVRPGADLEQVVANLERLQEAIRRRRAETVVTLNFVVMKSTRAMLGPFLDFARDAGIRDVAFIKLMPGGSTSRRFVQGEHLTWEEYEAIDWPGLRRRARQYGISMQRTDRAVLQRQGCRMPGTALYISATWDVTCCPYLVQFPDHRYGNLMESSIDEIYHSGRYREMRQVFTRGSWLPLCDECGCMFAQET